MTSPARSWLSQPASLAAPGLLGVELVVGERRGRIVEVEAYEGSNDGASHASGRVTDRNRIMFGPVGHLYVYLSYGIHWCANVVAHGEGEPGAVLIRAIEPVAGVDQMWADRPKAKRRPDLGSGPGKLCSALGITDEHNGVDLFSSVSPVRLEGAPVEASNDLMTGPRIGISKATDKPWRFFLANSEHVSRPRR